MCMCVCICMYVCIYIYIWQYQTRPSDKYIADDVSEGALVGMHDNMIHEPDVSHIYIYIYVYACMYVCM